MEQYLNTIFRAQTTVEVCSALQSALNALREISYLSKLPEYYEDVAAGTSQDVQDWFDDMKDDPQAQKEGTLKEVYGLFSAALSRLRKFGFHREED